MVLINPYKMVDLHIAPPGAMSASFPVYNPPKKTAASRNSRNSQLTTPKRSGRVSHRNTPYSTTTSRALQRAKASQNAVPGQEEDQLIGDTSYEEPSQPSQPSQPERKSPYSMHGAKDSGVQDYEEEKTDEDQSGDCLEEQIFRITPTKSIFSRTTTPVKTPTRPLKATVQSPPATGKKTWGQWLGDILPESVKKPVKAILGAPAGVPQTKDLIVGTPKKDMEDEYSYTLPGSFGKSDYGHRSPPLKLGYEHDGGANSYGSEFDISRSFSGTPSRVNPSDLFIYDKPKSEAKSTAPSKRARRSTMSTPIKANKVLPPISSLQKPNNFIERMRSAKKTNRYDPYARRSPAKKEKIQLTVEEEKELTPAEEVELVKQRQRERKIAALEDKYLMREALRAMGQTPDDEQMTDSDSEILIGDKGKGRERSLSMSANLSATVEDVPEEVASATKLPIAPLSPPKSPIKKTRESPQSMPSRNLFESAAPVPSFLVGAGVDTSPGFTISDASPPAENPAISLSAPSTTWSFGSDSSDKENISSGPPPPPTMSHAQLPAPLTASAQPPAVSGSLFGSQPAGGFGLGPPKESPAIGRQRSQAEKFAPKVSSSLRESRTAADYDDKENQSEKVDKENIGEGNSKKDGESELKKKVGLSQQTTQGSNVFAKKGLKENASVVNVGKNDVKVDVRAKVEAVSSSIHPLGKGLLILVS